jgi:hypothetical protein
MVVIIMAMTRTTIVADDALLDRLRAIAAAEQKSLGAVIREGLELRAHRDRPPLTFIGAFSSGEPEHDTARWSADAPYAPLSWRDDDH